LHNSESKIWGANEENTQMAIKELENKGALQILLFLHKRGKTKVTDIDVSASSSTLFSALTKLARLELIDEERQKPYTRYIQLTGEGEAIAKKIEEIENILEAKNEREAKRDRQ
jgi:DNA-binding transcriptional ArsR family regulator